MTIKDKVTISENAKFINQVTASKLESNVKQNMENNVKGAVIGGGAGVLIAIASRKNIFLYGIVGLVIGRFLFNVKQ
jgi:hypothetical protein